MAEFRPEVDEDVDDEHDVHYEVHHVERRAGITTALHGCLFLRGDERRIQKIKEERGENYNLTFYCSKNRIVLPGYLFLMD